ncbi:hypothetical protein D3C85_1659640 [compost metagenome]
MFAVLQGPAQAHTLTGERPAQLELPPTPVEFPIGLHGPNFIIVAVFQLWQHLSIAQLALSVPGSGNVVIQGLVRTLVVIDFPPLVKSLLSCVEVDQCSVGK